MSVKKATFYITGHEITLRSDHLPLKKFLRKMTLNDTINNRSTKIENFNINLCTYFRKRQCVSRYIKQINWYGPWFETATWVTGSWIQKILFWNSPQDKRIYISPENWWWKYWHVCEIQITYDNEEDSKFLVELPLDDIKFVLLQEQDLEIWELWDKVKVCMYNDFYLVKNNVLFKHIVDNGHRFEARVIPHTLVDIVLHLGHNQSGHNGYQRTYAAIKCLYYCKGMITQILKYCKHCKVCAQQKIQKNTIWKKIFETWCTTYGICQHGSVWWISPTIIKRKHDMQ